LRKQGSEKDEHRTRRKKGRKKMKEEGGQRFTAKL
jgi:hypothetical protein